jgi:sugar phosphate isomerase/epimerase
MTKNRRDLLKLAALGGATLALGTGTVAMAQDAGKKAPWAELMGWRLGCQLYSFNRYTFQQAVEKTAQTGARYCEIFLGQKIDDSKNTGDAVGNKEVRKLMKTVFADYGIIPLSVGVCGSDRAVFEFAAEMGLYAISSEPGFDQLAEINALTEEYKINLALHNHPKPSIYWDYKTVLEQLKDCGPRIGACADIGHWMRSEINPLEALKALKGRIIQFHFKDLHEFVKGHDVPWGTGKADVPAILAELAAQRFHGPFFAEYEHNWETSVPEITQSVAFFNETAKKIITE